MFSMHRLNLARNNLPPGPPASPAVNSVCARSLYLSHSSRSFQYSSVGWPDFATQWPVAAREHPLTIATTIANTRIFFIFLTSARIISNSVFSAYCLLPTAYSVLNFLRTPASTYPPSRSSDSPTHPPPFATCVRREPRLFLYCPLHILPNNYNPGNKSGSVPFSEKFGHIYRSHFF